MAEGRVPTWILASGIASAFLLLPVLAAWYYLGTDIFLVYLEQGLAYCL
ncbi:hypothetical protein [Rhizobium sp. L1K21]|nr:hypothetical protein [Rhizobium sp. L1K21]MCO6186561.1 hypothetical protein [Rhizobium sp. L1K21]